MMDHDDCTSYKCVDTLSEELVTCWHEVPVPPLKEEPGRLRRNPHPHR